MRRFTSLLLAGALAVALAAPAAEAAATPRSPAAPLWSWLGQAVHTLWARIAGPPAYEPRFAASETGPDRGPGWDPDGFAGPDRGSAGTDPTTGPDHGPEWDPNG